MSVWPQGRKSTVKQPRTSRRNSRRETSQPLRRSTATWLALLIPTTFNSCSTQSQTSLSPIISVAAVSIRINIAVVEPIDRHTLTLTCINTTDMYCENGGARENERLRDCQVAERKIAWQRGRERLKEREREKEIHLCTTATTTDHLRIPSRLFLSDTSLCQLFQPFSLSYWVIRMQLHNVYATLCIMRC